MTISTVLQELCASIPTAIGAVVCDADGEAYEVVEGAGAPVPASLERAQKHLPSHLPIMVPPRELLLRLSASEPFPLIRQLARSGAGHGAGDVGLVELRFPEVDVWLAPLEEDAILMLVVRRPALSGVTRRAFESARNRLGPLLEAAGLT